MACCCGTPLCGCADSPTQYIITVANAGGGTPINSTTGCVGCTGLCPGLNGSWVFPFVLNQTYEYCWTATGEVDDQFCRNFLGVSVVSYQLKATARLSCFQNQLSITFTIGHGTCGSSGQTLCSYTFLLSASAPNCTTSATGGSNITTNCFNLNFCGRSQTPNCGSAPQVSLTIS